MPTLPFAISPDELQNLGDSRAVEFMRRLLWAESARVGIGQYLVTVPTCINVADGGIDALIEGAYPSDTSVIPQGDTGFQIKATDLQPGECRRELHEGNSLSRPLKRGIKRLLDAGGTYILVLFKQLTNEKIEDRRGAVKDQLAKQGYSDVAVRLYTVDNIASMAERFPGVVAWIKPDLQEGLSYSTWARHRDIREPHQFVSDMQRTNWIELIQDEFRAGRNQASVVRVVGLSGIGKTRFVFEALAPDDLQSQVIYVTADQFRQSSLFQRLQFDENLSAVLVVDECDVAQHDEFVRAFSMQGSRLALITMFNDVANHPSSTRIYELGKLEEQAIEEILHSEFTNLPQNVVRRLTDFADGFPRIAIRLAESYRSNPGEPDEYITIGDDYLIDRLIGGNMRTDSARFNTTENVLMGISLFDKIGYEKDAGLDVEARWVSSLMEVQWTDFEKVVYEQKERGLIQGQYYLYVTPFMLKVHLFRKWWKIKGFSSESFANFCERNP